MVNKIDFKAKNLTSNAGLFLLLENAKSNGIFELIEKDLLFDNESTNKIKMNHIKTMLCGHFIGIDKLERLKLLQNDPLMNEFDISVKEPETVSRFLGNFTFKTTQIFRDINFKVFHREILESRIDRDNEIDIIESQNQLTEINAKKGKLLDLYLDDTFSKEQLDERVKPLETAVRELEERIKVLSKTNEDLYNDIAEIDEIIKVFQNENSTLQEEFNNGNITDKYSRKELLKDIENIVVGEDGSLTLNFKSLSVIRELTIKYRFLLEKAS